MTVLVLGLLLFLGGHSVRIVADGWRSAQIARFGELRWKAGYALVALLGFTLLVWGYGLSRDAPTVLWDPPAWTAHLTSLLTLPAFVLLAAAYVPGNRMKAAVGHPMVAGVALWALAHLLSNGRAGDALLFGAFLAWALVDFRAARRRDRLAGVRYPVASPLRDLVAVGVGIAAWALFAAWLHGWLIGVRPF